MTLEASGSIAGALDRRDRCCLAYEGPQLQQGGEGDPTAQAHQAPSGPLEDKPLGNQEGLFQAIV